MTFLEEVKTVCEQDIQIDLNKTVNNAIINNNNLSKLTDQCLITDRIKRALRLLYMTEIKL